ncbi:MULTISPECIES: hypothetical protein [Streptomyces]|nr:hypothetical protein [Streptomyces sp. KS_5]
MLSQFPRHREAAGRLLGGGTAVGDVRATRASLRRLLAELDRHEGAPGKR